MPEMRPLDESAEEAATVEDMGFVAAMADWYEVWYFTYPDVVIDTNTGLILEDNFELASDIIWNTYAFEWGDFLEQNAGIVNTLSEDNATIDYDLVWGNTTQTGSYPIKISAVAELLPTTVEEGEEYVSTVQQYERETFFVIWGQGDVSRPAFYLTEETPDTADNPSDVAAWVGPVSWDARYEVEYAGSGNDEVLAIKKMWKKYDADGDGTEYPSNFPDALDIFLTDRGNELHAYSPNVGEPDYDFQKTKRKPINLKKLSAFSESEIAKSTVSVSATTTTSMTDTGGSTY